MKTKLASSSLSWQYWPTTIAAFAHHSFAATYDESKTIEIKGKVVVFSFRNPHSLITVEVTDGGKKVPVGCRRTWFDAIGQHRCSERHVEIR